MEKKSENIHPDLWLKDLPTVPTEPEGFKPEEMQTCEKCSRTSPPTRTACFYCGNEFPASEIQNKYLKINLRKLEDWEKGFNVILLANNSVDETKLGEIAKIFDFERDELQSLLGRKKSLPIARVESEKEAEILVNRLKIFELESFILSDESLKTETILRRLRRVDFQENSLTLIYFNNNEIVDVKIEDIALIVIGALFERKVEAIESMKRKEKNKILDATELTSDLMLIDIYTKNDEIGYRIELNGFDFSCLGADKGMLAKDNMLKLIQKLREVSVNAKFDDDYLKIRGDLSKVWDVAQKSDLGGIDRKGMGGYQRKNTTTSSNLGQFTKYSRLQRKLI